MLIIGSTGIGKSLLASALGYHACSLGYKVAYFIAPKLFSRLKISKAEGAYLKDIAKIERVNLLILDDFELQPLYNLNRAVLMESLKTVMAKVL